MHVEAGFVIFEQGQPGDQAYIIEQGRVELWVQREGLRVRLAGQLDTIRHSDRMFTLILDDGQNIRGLAESVDPAQLASLFGQRAVVSGNAVFRPSGSVLRLEIDRLEPAGAESSVWSHMPRPALGRLESRPPIASQGPRSGVNKIFGRWPGKESEEEVLRALEALS